MGTVTDKSDWEIVLDIFARYLFHIAYQVFITANCFSGIWLISPSFSDMYTIYYIYSYLYLHIYFSGIYTHSAAASHHETSPVPTR